MKVIQAEEYGCTDLSYTELECTKGGIGVVAGGAILAAIKKLFDYVEKSSLVIKSPTSTTNIVNGVTNIVQTSGYWSFEHPAK